MTKNKLIAGLQVATAALAGIFALYQAKAIRDSEELIDIDNNIIKSSTRSLEVVRGWIEDGKVTEDMTKEYADAIRLDEETCKKLDNL